MNQGDILLVPFPKADMPGHIVHPAIVVAETHHAVSGDIDYILVMVTHKVGRADPNFDVVILDADQDFRQTQLRESSAIRTDKIVTLNSARIRRRLGSLGPRHLEEFRTKLRARLGL
jgi:mRNA-degrading endonuclease toxin of MazEF toxin-antitoxin module